MSSSIITSTSTSATTQNPNPPSLSKSLQESIQQISTSPSKALSTLLELQTRTSSLQLFSKNETMTDVTTSHIPLLGINHYIGIALLACPTSSSKERQTNVKRAVDLFHDFLQTLDRMDALSSEIQLEYHALLDRNQADQEHVEDQPPAAMPRYLGESRETKIARFQLKKSTMDELARLQALQERRMRLSADPEEEMDGYDDEGIQRTVNIAGLKTCSMEAIDEIYTALRELEMLTMAVRMEKEMEARAKHLGTNPSNHSHTDNNKPNPPQNQYQPSTKPLQITKITQDQTTGKLTIQKEELQAQIFRPSWNQPTMSLDQLAEMEIAQAHERSQRQAQAEIENQRQPRRYDQLVRDGLEDDAELVELSAVLDRRWDDFKEANPRGSGNKNADRGDRNF